MGTFYIDGKEFVGTIPDTAITFEEFGVPGYVTNINAPISASAEASFKCEVNALLFAKMTGVDLANDPDAAKFTLMCTSPYSVQRRTHKKKRINKKWAKRYGFVTRFRSATIEDVELAQDDYGYKFVGRSMNYRD